MIMGFLGRGRAAGPARSRCADGVTSRLRRRRDRGRRRRAALPQPNPPDGLLVGSTTAAMAAVAGAERSGMRPRPGFRRGRERGRSPFLRRFRQEIIVIREDVGRAGEFLARALVAAIERRAPEHGQGLDSAGQGAKRAD